MKTFHVHIKGVVQGVGFRPLVYRLAKAQDIKGWVNNASDGVHVRFHAMNREEADNFVKHLLENAPIRAVISHYSLEEKKDVEERFEDFKIIHSESKTSATLMITPDFATCPACLAEFYDKSNRRFLYPFITCTDCGPRYSIIESLPYDRERTSMKVFAMCPACQKEYEDALDRRYHSQTNSCKDCAIEMFLWTKEQGARPLSSITDVVERWKAGQIVAIKGVGGYLLTCDAANARAVALLRRRKNRPSKPLALMYPSWELAAEDVEMEVGEKLELESTEAPIVIMTKQQNPMHELAFDEIAPGLAQLGIMLPYTPLFHQLLKSFGKPVVATSGNLSGAAIVYEDEKAIKSLSSIADAILLNNREIVVPQDDSVLRFSVVKRRRILLRRSRGMAPSYIDPELQLPRRDILAMGAMKKSTFSLLHEGNLFVSQYLGNTDGLEAQENYLQVLNHINKLFKPRVEAILVDKHPAYFTSIEGQRLADEGAVPLVRIQHHQAHFWAVLGEHQLVDSSEKILGVVWDGTGLGDDGQIWGGEFFEFAERQIRRIHHLPYFDFILGDKMPREPRISALALAHDEEDALVLLKPAFTEEEWRIYRHLLQRDAGLKTSSVGRLFDAMAALILGIGLQTYEGEAAMLLEQAAYRYFRKNGLTARFSYLNETGLPANLTSLLLSKILVDLKSGLDKELLAAKFHMSLAHYVACFAEERGYEKVAFSGGVFQNACLVDLLILLMEKKHQLYFHHKLPPNDENISFGQLMAYLYASEFE